jgi:hypothetical protein
VMQAGGGGLGPRTRNRAAVARFRCAVSNGKEGQCGGVPG